MLIVDFSINMIKIKQVVTDIKRNQGFTVLIFYIAADVS